MSFILDALKKSEIERQRQSVPGLMDARFTARRKGLPAWAIALGVLFSINLAVLCIVLWRKSPTAVPATGAAAQLRPAPAAADSIDTAQPKSDHFSPLDSAPEFAPEIPVVGADAAASAKPLARRPGVEGRAGETARRADPQLVADAQTDDAEVLPSISEINLTGAQALPELHLDVHVYATKPAERFVYINMRKYHEGGTLPEGPSIERIRRDGVVLSFQGLRFILPRQP